MSFFKVKISKINDSYRGNLYYVVCEDSEKKQINCKKGCIKSGIRIFKI